MLSRLALMVQAAVLGGQFFDPFSLFDDGGVASKVGVGWSYVADALVVALVVVVIDEGADLVFEIAGQIIIFKQDPVLQRLMPALDLALGLRVIRCAPNVIHTVVLEPFSQIAGDIGRAVVAEQPRLVDDIGAIEA